MIDKPISEIAIGPAPQHVLVPGRSYRTISILLLLVFAGGLGGVAWANYDWLKDVLRSGTETSSNGGATTVRPDTTASTRDDTTAVQQGTLQANAPGGMAVQSITDLITAQQAEIKRVSEQLGDLTSQVAILSSKIDRIPDPSSWTAKAAAPLPARAGPVQAPARPAPVAIAHKKPVAAPKPADSISVGGAPLPVQPVR